MFFVVKKKNAYARKDQEEICRDREEVGICMNEMQKSIRINSASKSIILQLLNPRERLSKA